MVKKLILTLWMTVFAQWIQGQTPLSFSRNSMRAGDVLCKVKIDYVDVGEAGIDKVWTLGQISEHDKDIYQGVVTKGDTITVLQKGYIRHYTSYCKRKGDGWGLNLEIKDLPFYRMMYFRRIEYPLMFHFYFDLNCKRTVAKFPIEYYINLIKDVGEIIDAEWAFVANWNNGEILYKYNEAEVDRYLRLRKEEKEWSKEDFIKRRAKLAQVVEKVLDDKKNGKPKQTYIIE